MRGLFGSTPPTRVSPIRDGNGVGEGAVGDEPDIDAVEHGAKPLGHPGQPDDDDRELVQHSANPERLSVVHDRLEPQHVFAFGVALQGHQPEVDLEQGRVPPRCLDHDCAAEEAWGDALVDPAAGRAG